DPRGFDLGRFSNAGRPPTKTQPSRRDPHQKTFTIAVFPQSLAESASSPRICWQLQQMRFRVGVQFADTVVLRRG
ncbi:hypothetical protein, partial [Roseovarius sp. SYSU LYC5161]|uniref:hypothetical protein n=1 Tax=Roseovarius halophilus (ex Wu et al. 2025) TaxID=3376060 RepID=UPI00399C32E0